MMTEPAKPNQQQPPAKQSPEPRRGFLAGLMAIVIGGLVGLVPLASGLWALVSPLRRKENDATGFVKVTTLAAVPPDGVPRPFTVFADRQDAWNHYPGQPIGSVYLRRTAEDAPVEAYQATCPHAGCMVNFLPGEDRFQCPCHDSAFEPDGERINPASCPSPRPLDSLESEIRDTDGPSEVWVRYQEFRAGIPEKIAKA